MIFNLYLTTQRGSNTTTCKYQQYNINSTTNIIFTTTTTQQYNNNNLINVNESESYKKLSTFKTPNKLLLFENKNKIKYILSFQDATETTNQIFSITTATTT